MDDGPLAPVPAARGGCLPAALLPGVQKPPVLLDFAEAATPRRPAGRPRARRTVPRMLPRGLAGPATAATAYGLPPRHPMGRRALLASGRKGMCPRLRDLATSQRVAPAIRALVGPSWRSPAGPDRAEIAVTPRPDTRRPWYGVPHPRPWGQEDPGRCRWRLGRAPPRGVPRQGPTGADQRTAAHPVRTSRGHPVSQERRGPVAAVAPERRSSGSRALAIHVSGPSPATDRRRPRDG